MAADYQMLQLFGNVETLENYVLGILNNVHTNYDEEFEHTIRFKAVTLYISTCATCDPWAPLTDYLQLLANFRDWSNGGGFEIIYDLATLWTGRVLDNNIGGGGYFGGLCSNQRYQLLRRYSANAGLMRALQAHELGHNLNARHDTDGSPYIMAPRIQDVHEWSSVSLNTINTYFNNVVNAQNCVSACDNLTAPQAAFITTSTSGCAPLTVQFINQSAVNANSWQWLFPEGLTSFDKNPVATFTAPGTYKVQLVASNPIGFDTTETLILVKDRPDGAFSINSTEGSAMITTTNSSADATNYLWRFGDGKTSTDANPTHIYTSDGNYTVTLIAQNECGNDTTTQSVNISTAPTADFSAQMTSGCAPLTVQFQNNASANATAFEWQFPGGVPSSSAAQNPSVNYLQPGVYKVILIVRNATGNAMITKNDFITVKGKPGAAFSFSQSENVVTFTNQSLNAQSYLWNFGDDSISNLPNPVHTFSNPGTYAVQLIAMNECGNDTLQQNVTLSGAAPLASFNSNIQEGCAPFTVQFSDLTNGNVTQRNWFFQVERHQLRKQRIQ
ncbi:MAG: PKD domain-containing protein [Saprospiraceae bacterium]|nr:PKD domain-containing protein [Saprospiraceae bacterium]